MASDPIGISFMPSAEAQANGPRQAGIEGQGGSDLAQAFKILSLHLPRVLGASAIAPKRLLTSPGSAAIAMPSGSSPYAAVFQALLQQIGGGGNAATGRNDADSLSSLFGGVSPSRYDGGDGGGAAVGSYPGGTPPPHISPASQPAPPVAPSSSIGADYGNSGEVSGTTFPTYEGNPRQDTQYI